MCWKETADVIRQFSIPPDNSHVDIFEEHWKVFLAKLRELMLKFKIKSKEKFYDQNIIRTMFFWKPVEGPNQQNFRIDGVMYEMTNASKNGFWNSKLLILEVMRLILEINESNSSIDYNTLASSKKALIAELKKFDKDYIKHKKNVHPELNGYVMNAFIPLVNVMESNFELLKLEELMKKYEIPDF